jgi:hypothetical protein
MNSIGKYVKATDTASLKKIHEAFLYMRGAVLTQKISQDAAESAKLRSIPVDRIVFDELDLMDESVKAKARGRMGHSVVKEEVYISNPTIPDYGIDKVFQSSDQRHWFRRCSCGEWTCAELSFPDCVKIRKDGTGYIGCDRCGKPVNITPGEWCAQVPSNSDYMHGYRWSQLTSIFNDPAEILQDFVNPPEDNLADVYRLRLGLPYIAAEDRLTEQQVLARCGNNIMSHNHRGPCAMGVDVGKTKHIVIGYRTGKYNYSIIKCVRMKKWEDIHDIANRFNVKSCVVDIRPYEDSARDFQKAVKFRTFLCEYAENTPKGTDYNDKTGIVKVARTEIFDSTHKLIERDGLIVLPRVGPEMRLFAKHCANAAKVLELNKRTNREVYRYRKLGPDDYRNALNYFLLAASGGKIANIKQKKYRQKTANNKYKKC